MLQLKHRLSFFYVERGCLAVQSGCLVLTDLEDEAQYEVPGRATSLLMVGPGTSITTEAVRLAAKYGVLIVWVGEHGVRCYSAGRPWSDNTVWLERQVRCYADRTASLGIAKEMFYRRFGTRMERRSIEQLRGLEGARVRKAYADIANDLGVEWKGRRYVPGNPAGSTDAPNLALNVANTCLYGLVECAVYAVGMSSALGFIHRGGQISFVLDIADLYKVEDIIPLAFSTVADEGGSGEPWPGIESDVRIRIRNYFRETKFLRRVVADMTGLFDGSDYP